MSGAQLVEVNEVTLPSSVQEGDVLACDLHDEQVHVKARENITKKGFLVGARLTLQGSRADSDEEWSVSLEDDVRVHRVARMELPDERRARERAG